MATNDFLAFATAAGANVITQSTYSGLSARSAGFSNGIALPEEANKAWRQSSTWAAVLGQIIVDKLVVDATDDGNITTLKTNLINALVGNVFPAYSLSSNGYVIHKLSSTQSLILQWGKQSTSNGNFSFPYTFPNACLVFLPANIDVQGTYTDNAYGGAISTSQFFIATKNSQNPNTISNYGVAWMALGY